jgi:hypothetical protein
LVNSLVIKRWKGGMSVKRFFRMVVVLILGVILTGSPVVASAEAASIPSPPTEGTVSAKLHSSIVVNSRNDIAIQGVSLISLWSCGIQDNLNGTITVMGDTNTYSKVEYLDVTVYLQRWNGSGWVDVTNKTYSNSNSSYVSGSSIISASKGYYYRTRSVHNARNAGNNDTRTSVSEAILVN